MSSSSMQKVHLKMSVIVAEAYLSEAGTPRVRAWEHSHVGAAHRVATRLEQLGFLAFCRDPCEVCTCTKYASCHIFLFLVDRFTLTADSGLALMGSQTVP